MRVSFGVPVVIAACASLVAGAALAQPAAATVNVVRISVQMVDLPRGQSSTCWVNGQVTDVLAGPTYRQGQAIQIGVPCSLEPGVVDSRPAQRFGGAFGPKGLDARALAASKDGLASLDEKGRLIWSEGAMRGAPRSDWTIPWMGGYRVLDGAIMPLGKSRAS